ncbi:MAG: alkaline phosphatase family protein, partial [Gemmatimonadota bacterium]
MSQMARPKPRVAAFSVLALLFCSAPASAPTQGPSPQAPAPTLLVFITVDQLRPDYLDRYKSQFTGGLARFVKQGAFFTEAYQDHGITETAPGHASLMSGRFPRSTGITRNAVGVGDATSPLLGSTDYSASPRRFRGTTLTDWLLAKNP